MQWKHQYKFHRPLSNQAAVLSLHSIHNNVATCMAQENIESVHLAKGMSEVSFLHVGNGIYCFSQPNQLKYFNSLNKIEF